MVLVMMMVVA
jgi:hypothetical protein